MLLGAVCRAGGDTPLPSDWGLLSVGSQAPIFQNRLSPTPSRLLPLAAHAIELQAMLSHVNTWAQMPSYFVDGEWTQLTLALGYGLGHGIELGAKLPLGGRSGGFLDGTIMGFHDLFKVTQARRDRFARNRLRVATRQSTGWHTYLATRDASVGVANPVLSFRQALGLSACPGAPRLMLEAALKLPIGSMARQFATDNVALLTGLALQHAASARLDVALGGGIVLSPGSQRVYGIELSWLQKYLFAGVGLTLSSAWRLVFQYLGQDGIAERASYRPMDNTTHEFALGVQWAPASFYLVEAGLIENAIHDANTPDFGLHLGLRFYPRGQALALSPSWR
ncbi:MAG: DUF3187 family protein [Deltaproteobacteria bacterium]|nr:MAG: DUF3187 family protein [Deltaproteobacteria bacterium]